MVARVDPGLKDFSRIAATKSNRRVCLSGKPCHLLLLRSTRTKVIIAALYGLMSLATNREIEAGIALLITTFAIGDALVITAIKGIRDLSKSAFRYGPPTE
jgi:hypothetical protein